MKPLIPFFILINFFSITSIIGQTAGIDSLRSVLDTIKDNQLKIETLHSLSKSLLGRANEEAFHYAEKAASLAEKQGDSEKLARAYYIQSVACYYQGKTDSTILIAKKLYEFATINEDEKHIIKALGILGLSTGDQGNALQAAKYYYLNLKKCEELDDYRCVGVTCNNLAGILISQKDKKGAKRLCIKGIEALKKGNFPKVLATIYITISFLEEDLSIKEQYILDAVEIAKETNDLATLGQAYKKLGFLYQDDINDYETALKYYKLALAASKETGFATTIYNINQLIAVTYGDLGKNDSCIFLLKKLEPNLVASKEQKMLSENYFYLARSYKAKNQFDNAYSFLLKHIELKDTLYNENVSEQLAEANTKYETEQKENQIAQQKLKLTQQKSAQNKTILGGIIAFLLTSGIFFWYYQTQKRKKIAAESALEIEQAKANSLEELDTLKSKFFTNISHELRTPLTLISGPIENAMGQAKTPSVRADLKLAHSNSKKLLNLVNEILDLSKLESGKLQVNESVVNLEQLLRRIFFSFSSLAEIRDVELVYQNEIEKTYCFKTDIDKFEKICNNLISNAIKYTPSGGTINLLSEITNGRLSLSISDTGKGIHVDDLPKVFDRFYQSSQQNEPLQGGTGVGLALARELSRLFRGDLSVNSTLGKGSVFKLNIPIEQAENSIHAVEIEEAIKEKSTKTHYAPVLMNGQKPKLLIIEDNPEMSQYLISLLASEYNCSTAMNGKQGLDMLQKQSFDLVTCDVMMPEMDGFELRQKLNEDQTQRYTPFIFLTARVLEEDKIKGLQLGVDDYIAKPFSKTELLARIHNLLNNKVERDLWQKENKREEEDIPETAEDQLLRQAEKNVLENLDNVQFKVNDLATNIGYNQRSLSRIIKKTTGLSTVNFILEIRLQKARQLLEQRRFLTVNEVRYEIGIDSASYFTTKFTARFGRNPKAYLGD